MMKMLAATVLLAATVHAAASPPISKSIDFYVNFPARTLDFIVGNNSMVRAPRPGGPGAAGHTA
jgi:hypothetical protein